MATSPFVQGQRSELDWVLYGVVMLAAGTLVGTVDLMGVSQAATLANGGTLARTNLPQPNTIPQEWDYFEVQAICLKFFHTLSPATAYTGLQDAFYSIKVAGFEYKAGHISELVLPNSVQFYVAATVLAQTDYRVGAWVPLKPNIVIPAITQVNFTCTFLTDQAEFHSVNLFGGMKGILHKKIAG
jgi:hypothetical protein